MSESQNPTETTEQTVRTLLAPIQQATRDWSEEHERLDGELRESLDMLEAFEQQLAHWQTQIAEQQANSEDHSELLDEALAENDRLAADLAAASEGGDAVRKDLGASQQRCDELATKLAEFEEQLSSTEAEKDRLADQLATRKQEYADRQTRWEEDFRRLRDLLRHDAEADDPPSEEQPNKPAPADPVVGSVVAQFDKLRAQRAGRLSRNPS